MSYCSKCGTKVSEEMKFCPKCGASLKVEQVKAEAVPPAYRAEKAEKQEKREKEEKQEKGEKEEKYERRRAPPSFIGPLVGGFVLILLGLMFYLAVTASLRWEAAGALFFVLIGIVIIVGAAYAALMASGRHPKT